MMLTTMVADMAGWFFRNARTGAQFLTSGHQPSPQGGGKGPFAVLAAALALLLLAIPASATEIQRVVSPGGIEAWLVEEHAVPVIAVDFAFKGGAAEDPEGKAGLANFLTGMLDEGAGELDSAAFQKAIEDASVSMSFSAGRDEFYGSLKTLTINRGEAFRLLKLALNEPRFDAEPVDRIRAQIVAGLKQDRTDPETLAFDLWYETAFPGHAYGRRKEGTEESLARITADDLRTFRNNVFARAGLKVAIVGDIDAATLAPLLDDVFGALPATATQVETAEVTPLAAARRDETMAIPQTVIRFGSAGLKRADPDFIPAYILNHILGGGSFTSRLYNEVREKRGLAYSVYTFLAPYEHSAIFLGGVATRADRAEDALALIRAEIKRIADEGPTAEELEKAKSYLIGSYALRFDTSSKISGQLVQIQLDDLGIDYINTRNDQIAAVTLDDVKRVAKRLFADKDLVIVTVGQPGS